MITKRIVQHPPIRDLYSISSLMRNVIKVPKPSHALIAPLKHFWHFSILKSLSVRLLLFLIEYSLIKNL